MNKKDGGSAYPDHATQTGMSLRDYFAGQALLGFIQSQGGGYRGDEPNMAYKVADEMIKERNKK